MAFAHQNTEMKPIPGLDAQGRPWWPRPKGRRPGRRGQRHQPVPGALSRRSFEVIGGLGAVPHRRAARRSADRSPSPPAQRRTSAHPGGGPRAAASRCRRNRADVFNRRDNAGGMPRSRRDARAPPPSRPPLSSTLLVLYALLGAAGSGWRAHTGRPAAVIRSERCAPAPGRYGRAPAPVRRTPILAPSSPARATSRWGRRGPPADRRSRRQRPVARSALRLPHRRDDAASPLWTLTLYDATTSPS